MYKKILLLSLLVVLLAIFYTGFGAIRDRLQRQKINQETLNKKAEEITVTILEGWNNREIGEYLEKQGIVTLPEFTKTLDNYNFAEYGKILPKNSQAPLQGFLYPDTYRFFKSISDRSKNSADEAGNEVIKKLLNNFFSKLPANAESLAKQQGLNLYEALTLASIVEKEANNFPEEKQTIAGIFYNRLQIGMALQSDATINYATGKSQPSASLVDLEIDSAYNTYKNKGLPPTPISNPSLASINAVLNPKNTDYLYYLHDQKTGQPIYAKTFEEHVQNKFKYLK